MGDILYLFSPVVRVCRQVGQACITTLAQPVLVKQAMSGWTELELNTSIL